MALALAVGGLPALTACSTAGGGVHPVSSVTAKQALIDCDTAYVAIATVVAYLPADKQVAGRSIQAKAWQALLVARSLYAANQSPNVVTLTALLLQVRVLAGVGQ